MNTHIFNTKHKTFDIPKRKVLPSPCKQPPADKNKQELNEKIASGSIYLNPILIIVSFDPNRLEHGFKIGNKTAQTIAPQMNEIRIRSAITCHASCDLPLPYKYESCVAAAIAKKKPNVQPIPSNTFIVDTADNPSSPIVFDIQIDVMIP